VKLFLYSSRKKWQNWSILVQYTNTQRQISPTMGQYIDHSSGRQFSTCSQHCPASLSSTNRRVPHTEIHIPLLIIIAPPWRERNFLPARTLYRKRRDKHQQLRTATDSRSKNVIVLQEPLWVFLADIELDHESDDEVHHHGGVDTDGEVPQIPRYDGCDNVVETEGREASMREVEGERDREAEGESEHDPLIGAADAEHVFGECAEGDGLRFKVSLDVRWEKNMAYVRIEGLDDLAGPDVGTLDGKQDLALIGGDCIHQSVVDDCSENRPDDLNCEGTLRTEFTVLS